jgi:hypothetical protein
MVKCCVFFEMRTEFLNIVKTSFSFKELKSHILNACTLQQTKIRSERQTVCTKDHAKQLAGSRISEYPGSSYWAGEFPDTVPSCKSLPFETAGAG